jgi:hypothetical protein
VALQIRTTASLTAQDAQAQANAVAFASGVETYFVALFVGPIGPINPLLPFSAWLEASFPGYAEHELFAAGLPPVTSLRDQAGYTQQETANFLCTGNPTVPQTILGYFITDGGGDWFYAELFDEPVLIVSNGDGLSLNFSIGSPTTIWGS